MTGKQNLFCKIPKSLYFNEALYNALSLGAVVVYCFMLERKSLSYSNSEKWTDIKGNVFIYFSRADVEYYGKCKHDKATKILQELESSGLIKRVRQGLGRPDRIYVYDLPSISSGYTTAQWESKCDTCGDDKTDSKQAVIPTSVNLDYKKDGDGFSDSNNIKNINNDFIKTHSYKQSERSRAQIKEQIGFCTLCKTYSEDQVNFLVGTISDIVSSKNRNICIAGSTLDGNLVRASLAAVTQKEAMYALHYFNTEKDAIRYPKAFLLTRIWEAINGALIPEESGCKSNIVTPSGELTKYELGWIRRAMETDFE